MIKIIKEGTRKECECGKCGCIFSYEAEDITKFKLPAGIAGMPNELTRGQLKEYINCPQCNTEIVLLATK